MQHMLLNLEMKVANKQEMEGALSIKQEKHKQHGMNKTNINYMPCGGAV